RLAVADQANSDARADGDVGEIAKSLPRSPLQLGQRRTVHVGVETGWNVQRPLEPPGHVGASPSRLRRGRDRAVGDRSRIKIDRSEAADAERQDLLHTAPVKERLFDRSQR